MAGERTVLFSTHITSDLERVADRIAILQDGKIIYCGELDVLKDRVKRLHVQAAAPLPNGSFSVPGMLHAKVTGNEAVVSVQDFTADLPERIAQQWSASVAVQDLNLEDIFLELHHG
jgi:ABC-2 type transport system ATP-binding protein